MGISQLKKKQCRLARALASQSMPTPGSLEGQCDKINPFCWSWTLVRAVINQLIYNQVYASLPSIICKWSKQVAANLEVMVWVTLAARKSSCLSRTQTSSFNIFKRKQDIAKYLCDSDCECIWLVNWCSFEACELVLLLEINWFLLHRTTVLQLFLQLLNNLSSSGYLTKRPRWPFPLCLFAQLCF